MADPKDVKALLTDLISIPSYVDGKVDESNLSDFIVRTLSKNPDLKIKKQKVEGKRCNLIVTGAKDPKVILFGHTDTVPPKVQKRNPLVAFEEDGKIYGLGSVDMKSGLAVMLDIALNNHRPEVGYVFSVDEEYDFKGALKLKEIKNIHPDMIINLEPTNLKILNGCRGITEFEFEVYGKSAHAGRKQLGINAIEKGVEMVNLFEKECAKFDSKEAKSSVNLAYLTGGLKSTDGGEVKRMGNVVPNYAKIVVEIRIASPKVDKVFVTTVLSKIAKKLAVDISKPIFKFYLGSMFTSPSKLKMFEGVMKKSGLKCEYADINSTGYFEVQMLQQDWGGDVVVFGASPSEKSHMDNEYVETESVLKVREVIGDFLNKIIKR